MHCVQPSIGPCTYTTSIVPYLPSQELSSKESLRAVRCGTPCGSLDGPCADPAGVKFSNADFWVLRSCRHVMWHRIRLRVHDRNLPLVILHPGSSDGHGVPALHPGGLQVRASAHLPARSVLPSPCPLHVLYAASCKCPVERLSMRVARSMVTFRLFKAMVYSHFKHTLTTASHWTAL